MLNKYVEERFPPWHALGYYGNNDPPDENISDANMSFDARVSPIVAELLIARHNEVLAAFAKLADAFDKAAPEKFKEFWYGEKHERTTGQC